MLVLSRKLNETIEIAPQDDAGLKTLAEAFASGAIQISLVKISGGRVKVLIEAPRELRVLRPEQARTVHGGSNEQDEQETADPSVS